MQRVLELASVLRCLAQSTFQSKVSSSRAGVRERKAAFCPLWQKAGRSATKTGARGGELLGWLRLPRSPRNRPTLVSVVVLSQKLPHKPTMRPMRHFSGSELWPPASRARAEASNQNIARGRACLGGGGRMFQIPARGSGERWSASIVLQGLVHTWLVRLFGEYGSLSASARPRMHARAEWDILSNLGLGRF